MIDHAYAASLLDRAKPNSSGCFIWQDGKTKDGYGRVRRYKIRYTAQRLLYQSPFGEVPKHLSVRHTCDKRDCINPAHLFLATHKENVEDRNKKGRTYRKGKKKVDF